MRICFFQRPPSGLEYGKAHRYGRRRGKSEQCRRTLTPGNVLVAAAGFLFLACLSVTIVLNLRSIYYTDIRYLQLERQTGYSEQEIRENYDTLIDYNLITKQIEELEFPSFPMSDSAAVHFKEVKQIFVSIQYLCIVTGVILLIGLGIKLRLGDFGSLKLISILTVLVPAVLGLCAALSWDTFFIRFHELFFDNDYWLFDPVTDPVILILPDTFFAHCAAAVLFFLLLGGILTGAAYRFGTRKSNN